MGGLASTGRISALKQRMLDEPRFLSIEQAVIVTEYYKANPDKPRNIQRAESLAETLRRIEIRIDPLELIVGNRTAGVRAGVVSPEAGISWVDAEIEGLPERPQDKFEVRSEDVEKFRLEILPFWKGKSLEDRVKAALGDELTAIGKVAKINQTDHSQGHICPSSRDWLRRGPRAIRDDVLARAGRAAPASRDFYRGMAIALEGALDFMGRYASLARRMAADEASPENRANLEEIARICLKLSVEPPSDLPRGRAVPLVPVRAPACGIERLFVLSRAGGPVSLPVLQGRPRDRDPGQDGGAGDRRGALAQVQPDRLSPQLQQREIFRWLPYRLQRRHWRPRRKG